MNKLQYRKVATAFVCMSQLVCGVASRAANLQLFGKQVQDTFYSTSIVNNNDYRIDVTPIVEEIRKSSHLLDEQLKSLGNDVSSAIKQSGASHFLTDSERKRMRDYYDLNYWGNKIGVEVDSDESTEFVEKNGLTLFHKLVADRIAGLNIADTLVQASLSSLGVSGETQNNILTTPDAHKFFEFLRTHRNERTPFSELPSEKLGNILTPQALSKTDKTDLQIKQFLSFIYPFAISNGLDLKELTHTHLKMNPNLLLTAKESFLKTIKAIDDPTSKAYLALQEELKTCSFIDKEGQDKESVAQTKLSMAQKDMDSLLGDDGTLEKQIQEKADAVIEFAKSVEARTNQKLKKFGLREQYSPVDYHVDLSTNHYVFDMRTFLSKFEDGAYASQKYAQRDFNDVSDLFEAVRANRDYNKMHSKPESWIESESYLLRVLSKFHNSNGGYMGTIVNQSDLEFPDLEASSKSFEILKNIQEYLEIAEKTEDFRELIKINSDAGILKHDLQFQKRELPKEFEWRNEVLSKRFSAAGENITNLKKALNAIQMQRAETKQKMNKRCLLANNILVGAAQWKSLAMSKESRIESAPVSPAARSEEVLPGSLDAIHDD